jgi:hypothetical protein
MPRSEHETAGCASPPSATASRATGAPPSSSPRTTTITRTTTTTTTNHERNSSFALGNPLDASLNLPRELFSHGVRRLVAKEVSRASLDEVVELAKDFCGATIAKRQVEEFAVGAAQDFEASRKGTLASPRVPMYSGQPCASACDSR